jgi:hypothetical protein
MYVQKDESESVMEAHLNKNFISLIRLFFKENWNISGFAFNSDPLLNVSLTSWVEPNISGSGFTPGSQPAGQCHLAGV